MVRCIARGPSRRQAPHASFAQSPLVPAQRPNPPGQVFAFKVCRTWVSRLVRARSDQPDPSFTSHTQKRIPRVVDGGVTATGVLSCQRGNLITIVITHY